MQQPFLLPVLVLLAFSAPCVLTQTFQVNGQDYYIMGPQSGEVSWDEVRYILGDPVRLGAVLPSSGFLNSLNPADIDAALRAETDWATSIAFDSGTNETFENYGQTVQFSPAKMFYPSSVEDIQAAVLEAKQKGKRIRAAGRKHSEAPIFGETGDYLIFTKNLKHIQKHVDGPQSTWTVQMESGVTTGDFNNFCKANNLSIPANVIPEILTMGGVISTGSHGTGANVGIVSDLVVELRIVDSEGVLRTYKEGETPEHVIQAARVNLGLFGILYDFKIKVDPMKNVKRVDSKPTMDSVLLENRGQRLKDMLNSHFSVQMIWYPFNDKVWLKQVDLTDEEPSGANAIAVLQSFDDWVSLNMLGMIGQPLVERIPRLTPLYTQLAFKGMTTGTTVVKLPDAIAWVKYLDSGKVAMLELAMDIETEEHFQKYVQCWYWVVNRVNEYAQQGKYPLNLSLDSRFIRRSHSTLSPARGYNLTVYIEILSGIKTEGIREFQKEVVDAWERINPGNIRFHWPKYSHWMPDIVHRLQRQYGSALQEFEQVRKELNVDPNRMFYNSFFEDLFSSSNNNEDDDESSED